MKYIKIVAFLAACCIFVSLGSLLTVSASGVEETYDMSEEYKNSKYYENFKSISLSGDQASDVIAIALSQLGYHEGNSEADLGGLNLSGTRDFVEYNVLYGKIDNNQGNGKSYGYYWCASFVNWCLRQARVSVYASAAAEISCQRWLKKCDQYGIYKEKGSYLPTEGDLIFFKDKGSNVASTHMGLVLYSDGERVFTIEGNTSNDNTFSSDGNYVAIKSYTLDSDYIVGYAKPDYEKNGDVQRVDRAPYGKTVGTFISADKIELEADGVTVATVNEFEIFTVTEITSRGFFVEYTKNGEKYSGFAHVEDNAVQIRADAEGYKVVEFLDSNGKRLMNSLCVTSGDEIRVPDITPVKDGMDFVSWIDGDGNNLFAGDIIETNGDGATLKAVWQVRTTDRPWQTEDTVHLAITLSSALVMIAAGVTSLVLFNRKKRTPKQ